MKYFMIDVKGWMGMDIQRGKKVRWNEGLDWYIVCSLYPQRRARKGGWFSLKFENAWFFLILILLGQRSNVSNGYPSLPGQVRIRIV